MQTFLPYADFAASAQALDTRRLGKQRVEALQILRALHCEDYGWRNHPAVTMWRGHTVALVSYGAAVVDHWRTRGFGDTTLPLIAEFVAPERPAAQQELASGPAAAVARRRGAAPLPSVGAAAQAARALPAAVRRRARPPALPLA